MAQRRLLSSSLQAWSRGKAGALPPDAGVLVAVPVLGLFGVQSPGGCGGFFNHLLLGHMVGKGPAHEALGWWVGSHMNLVRPGQFQSLSSVTPVMNCISSASLLSP